MHEETNPSTVALDEFVSLVAIAKMGKQRSMVSDFP
jgi:hypothetical protein